ncbi:Putative Type IIC bifunctional restriction-modification protein with endonuclease and N6-adenine DNA methyltransferase activity [Synechococcus sp. RS9907]|uniref:BREX-1 system adenine-specific DNA-methyltransferase PglX n=1 Tax=Synechococcus sp. RS9907 TaxID=221350 RepID=UPI00165D63AE|nr:BREX-1 system adenine-specific DNA-methyltransferase PglX [Synechococcus sp. RS9907]QNI82807.1 Putative Type IIC bifunctional restriction-modification protein with endonuclease and N6-adenine DNA methyltransferase activity [Synechococcus sp. RS9907]
MAVNTAALKTFAPAMRRQLMEAVGRKLDLLLNSQTPDTLSTYAKQIAELRDEQEKSREQLLERVAYTWFNRLCALRYLDAKGWHPFGCKVLMPADGSETQPELLKLMRSGSLPEDLKTFTNEQRLNQLLDGQIPTAIPGGDAQGEVYRELVLAACRSYHNLLPDLFEGLDDASELLLPDDLLTEGSIAGSFRSAISDSDCEDVEIIGWLYQFYISEKKDEVIGKVVKSEDIPAATQLFTPNWIVKYMVQNTIGAQWLATYPDSPLREQMEFYIEPAEQTDEVKAKLAEITPTSLNPEELTLMDPACGSGHILVEAYEIFKAIYLEQGYQLREIPRLIFEKNLFGLDIDKRAVQLTTFALTMKGRADDRRLLDRNPKFNIMAFKNSANHSLGSLLESINPLENSSEVNCLSELDSYFKKSRTFGSLIQIPSEIVSQSSKIIDKFEGREKDFSLTATLNYLKDLLKQADLLSRRYSAVVANPPYMGGKSLNGEIKAFLSDRYVDTKSDLFSAFTVRCTEMGSDMARIGIMCPNVWMYISSHEKLRKYLLSNQELESLIELPLTGFKGATVQICSYVLSKKRIDGAKASFIRLVEFKGGDEEMAASAKHAIRKRECGWLFEAAQSEFEKVAGTPIAYWTTNSIRHIFKEGTPLGQLTNVAAGMQTGDNERFIRTWPEVSLAKCGFDFKNSNEAAESSRKWFPYNKGGEFRKWFGNNEYLLNWENDGLEVKAFKPRSVIRNPSCYFQPSVTWSFVSSSYFGVRHSDAGSLFDVGGSSAFPAADDHHWVTGFLCSKQAFSFMKVMNPTLNFQVGNVSALPILLHNVYERKRLIDNTVKDLVKLAREDWDTYERSWNFQSLPLLNASNHKFNLQASYVSWISSNKLRIEEMNRLEERNNSLFIDAFSLEKEIDPSVAIQQITLTINPAYRYGGDATEEEKWERFQRDSMAELLSYATGCMMGRYSLDHPGLILADSRNNQDEQIAAYEAKTGKTIHEIQFKPDADAIIPVLDGEWFEDDIVARTREFLKVTFPESSVAENLRFIEDSIGKDIRKYFCKDFYKDHLQTYKKRPIYWMVQSPKAGFACLIYLHRYTPDTLLQVLNNYFRPYLQKLEARQEQLERDQSNDALPKREQTAARKEAEKITKVLKECQAWEQDALMPLAQQRIELDLDDGVKVNYLKLQEVLAKIPGLAAKGD